MLISFCTPCMNRNEDLKTTLPIRIATADSLPPVEIAIVDYNSKDRVSDILNPCLLTGKTYFTYRRYSGRDTYHAAHANNLAMTLGSGEWVVLVPADVYLHTGYLYALRQRIEEGCIWANTQKKHRSVIAIRKSEFIASGGYDERFEMYGPDDVDLIERLHRRGCKHGIIPDECISSIYTSPAKKIENYRLKISHKELGAMNMPWLEENRRNQVLVANPDGWGKWK